MLLQSRNLQICLFFDLYCVVEKESIFALHEMWSNHEDRKIYWQNALGLQMNAVLGRYLIRPMNVFELQEICL